MKKFLAFAVVYLAGMTYGSKLERLRCLETNKEILDKAKRYDNMLGANLPYGS